MLLIKGKLENKIKCGAEQVNALNTVWSGQSSLKRCEQILRMLKGSGD